jgi:hypothetical protein
MKLTKFISFGAAMTMAIAPIAASQAQTAAQGGYMVVRDGKVVSSASTLVAGDRVVTRGSEGASLALEGCTLEVPAASSVTIAPNACSSSVQSLNVARAGNSMYGSNAMKGSTVVVALLALTAVVLGGIAAAGGDDAPTSP